KDVELVGSIAPKDIAIIYCDDENISIDLGNNHNISIAKVGSNRPEERKYHCKYKIHVNDYCGTRASNVDKNNVLGRLLMKRIGD
ncbi:10879_t:CDS:1, partial [Racocetra persica]